MATKKKETELKLVKKSDILLLKVFCADEYFSECSFAVIRITKEVLKSIKGLKAIMDIVKNGDGEDNSPSLYKMTYWSSMWAAEFLHDDDMPSEFYVEATSKEDEVQHISKYIEQGEELRCDIEMTHIYKDGIRFECGVKNSNIRLETCIISFKELGL
jgi:CDP-glycerol glycerophosphotransferase (TagB/SpsB family)